MRCRQTGPLGDDGCCTAIYITGALVFADFRTDQISAHGGENESKSQLKSRLTWLRKSFAVTLSH